jgi:sigma-B regulation protein RsbU (phosphoserine phosphatase)
VADELVGQRRFQDLLTVGGRIFHQTHWAPLLQMQGSISEVKLELLHRDGSTIPIVVNALVRLDGGVKVHEIAAFVARDRDKYEKELVLSRKRLEDLVAQATRLQAEAKDRAVFAEQMIGIVSHDLRNPLSSIQMGTALMGRGELSLNQQRVLGRISRSAERATRLIADLLDFTQARLGHGLAVTAEELDLHVLVAETIEELTTIYPARALVHRTVGAGPCVADADRLAQLIGNLVSNAMAYGRPDRPITVVSTIEGDRFSISVHNEGAPIPPDVQTTLFQPMTRGTVSVGGGRSVGLGLYIVNEIAKAHGGQAAVKSLAESGTTFSIACPAVTLRGARQ